ncbi:hypothetical protein [Actinophytocola sp.]|uniref:hypothetical protein n=1 Tax=Actinophytocola sp. TaxID=1872138 RepID=UPI002D7EC117|nr:hypothetical protein [Actinophytocola sp.]HET9144060.1 hypothetical protein [Actinophytocola sp.]
MTDEWKPPTVADLIAKLSTMDPTLPVVLAEDEEGNGFDTWGGDVVESLYDTEYKETYLTPEAFAEDQAKDKPRFTDDEPPEIGGSVQRVAVVWP